mgnify:CR=1 FL=1
MVKQLAKLCSGRGGICSNGKTHASCTGGRASAAAIFPAKLCKTILKGMKNQLEADGRREVCKQGDEVRQVVARCGERGHDGRGRSRNG